MLFLILLLTILVAGILCFQGGQRGQASSSWRKVSITNAQVVALGAGLTGDITLFSLAAGEILENILINVTSPGAGSVALISLTMAAGKTGAGYIDCIVASDVKTAAISLGILAAQRGTSMTAGGDVHAYAAATYKAHFVAVGENLDQVTGFACDVYYKTSNLP